MPAQAGAQGPGMAGRSWGPRQAGRSLGNKDLLCKLQGTKLEPSSTPHTQCLAHKGHEIQVRKERKPVSLGGLAPGPPARPTMLDSFVRRQVLGTQEPEFAL